MSAGRSSRRALVLGAGGHVGNAVARALIEGGWMVTGAGRRVRPPANLAGIDIRYQSGDLAQDGQLEAWCANQDLVVDAAAPYPVELFSWTGAERRQPLDAAASRTRTLLQAVERSGCRLAYVSSFATRVRRRKGLPALQSSLLRRLHPYFRVKESIEARILEAAGAGLPAVVINPTTCLGPWDSKPPDQCLVPLLLRGEVGAVAEHVVNVIDVRDVARGLVAAVESKRYGEPLLLTGHALPVSQLVAWLCEIGEVDPPRWKAPAVLSVLPSLAMEALWAAAGKASPSPTLVPGLLCEQEFLSPGRSQLELGVRPRSLHRTLLDSVAWYQALGYC